MAGALTKTHHFRHFLSKRTSTTNLITHPFSDPNPISTKLKPMHFSSASSSSYSSRFGWVDWYSNMSKTRPILTKSITSAIIFTAADLSSQTIVRRTSTSESEGYDLIRTLRMGGYGLLILGPSLHFWFHFVSKILPKRNLFSTVTKMVLAQTVFGPVKTCIFFSINAALQGENGSEIVARLKRDLPPSMINGIVYWAFCDFVTFKFTPVHLQPLVSNAFSYLWTVYMTYMASLDKVSTS